MKVLFTILGIMLIGASGVQAQDCNPNPPQGMQEIAAYSIFQGITQMATIHLHYVTADGCFARSQNR